MDPDAVRELADALEGLLLSYGWVSLKNTDPAVMGGKDTNLPIKMREDYRAAITAAVEADPETESVTEAVNEGLALFLAGRFVVPDRARAPRGAVAHPMVNLNVRPSLVLNQQVKAAGGVPSKVAAEYLLFKYGIGPYAAGPASATVLARGSQRNPALPRVVRDLIRAKAAESEERVDDIVNEGFTRYLDGEFVLEPVEWPAGWEDDKANLKMHPNDALFEQVKERGGPRAPMQVAFAYLLDQFGIEPDGTESQ